MPSFDFVVETDISRSIRVKQLEAMFGGELMPGPAPKPVELKVLKGNPGKRKLPNSPKFSPLTEHPSDEMTPIGKALWWRITQELGRTNVLLEIEPKYVAVTLERLAGMGLEPKLT